MQKYYICFFDKNGNIVREMEDQFVNDNSAIFFAYMTVVNYDEIVNYVLKKI